MSTFNQTANHNVVLKAARDIGVSMTNMGAEDLASGQVLNNEEDTGHHFI